MRYKLWFLVFSGLPLKKLGRSNLRSMRGILAYSLIAYPKKKLRVFKVTQSQLFRSSLYCKTHYYYASDICEWVIYKDSSWEFLRMYMWDALSYFHFPPSSLSRSQFYSHNHVVQEYDLKLLSYSVQLYIITLQYRYGDYKFVIRSRSWICEHMRGKYLFTSGAKHMITSVTTLKWME